MSKRLEIDYIRIKDVQFGEKTSLKDGVLTVNKQELIDIAASELFGSLDIQLAKPGESCRILGIHDVMRPAAKRIIQRRAIRGYGVSLLLPEKERPSH